MKTTEIKTDEQLEGLLNDILTRLYVLEKEIQKLDTEVGVITEHVFEAPSTEGYDS